MRYPFTILSWDRCKSLIKIRENIRTHVDDTQGWTPVLCSPPVTRKVLRTVSPDRLPNQATLPDSATFCQFGPCEIQNNPKMHCDNSNNTFLVFQFRALNSYNYWSLGIYLYIGNTFYHFFKWNKIICIFKTKELRKKGQVQLLLKILSARSIFFPPGEQVKVVKILC